MFEIGMLTLMEAIPEYPLPKYGIISFSQGLPVKIPKAPFSYFLNNDAVS